MPDLAASVVERLDRGVQLVGKLKHSGSEASLVQRVQRIKPEQPVEGSRPFTIGNMTPEPRRTR